VDDAKLDTRGIGIFNNGVETCPCPAKKPCYHISLATLYRAKVTARRRREAARDPKRGAEPVIGQPRAPDGALVTTRRGTDGEGLRGREF
jgi:hypothetical protein